MAEYKRYMCFSYTQYKALGGLSDCKASFDEKEEAVIFVKGCLEDVEIFDRVEGNEIYDY